MWRSNDVEALGCLSDALRDEDCGVLPLEWALWARLRPARYLRVMDDRRPPLSVRSRRRTRRAGRCSPPHGAAAGCRSSAATEERDFQNCISPGGVCGALRANRMIYFPKIPACELACPICGPKTAEHAYCGPPPAEASARAAQRRRNARLRPRGRPDREDIGRKATRKVMRFRYFFVHLLL